ncbi:MAG: hypothetical protein AAFY56_09195, partial [Pseudomonadota bacterium]
LTEVVFKDSKAEKLRPDALLTVHTGHRTWTALIEAKVGRAEFKPEQIEGYAALAKSMGVDAVVTISNQFVALPDHHPTPLPKNLTKHVKLFHWSWMFIITQASLLMSGDNITDNDQKFILKEMLRFFAHSSSGVSNFDRMNTEWRELVSKIQAGAELSKVSNDVENTVASWHQEVRDLALIMSRKLQCEVTVRLKRTESASAIDRLRGDIESLINDHCLTCSLVIPDAAAPLEVKADLRTRCVSTSMRLAAPSDRKSSKARTNWLVRMLSKTEPEDVYVRAYWPGRAPTTQAGLLALREDPEALAAANRQLVPSSFEVFAIKDFGGRFSGTRTFIEDLENVIPAFYENVGQRLSQWQPPPPKIKPELSTTDLDEVEGQLADSQSGNSEGLT